MGINAKHFFAIALISMGVAMAVSARAFAAASPQDDKTLTVSGVVKSSEGEPLIGAVVSIKGVASTTASIAMTDIDGRYTLKVPSDAVIAVSLLGFADKEQAVGGGPSLISYSSPRPRCSMTRW